MVRAKTVFFLAFVTFVPFEVFLTAHAQQAEVAVDGPVYSLEAVEINGQPLPGGPTQRITIAPGDTFTVKLMLRNWSPQGQKLRGYQAMIDRESFKSGAAGTVQPVDYGAVPDNQANAYIDRKDSGYIFPNLDSFPIVDASSANYRWMNVLLEAHQGPVARQDGKKYVCATLKLKASPDASGTFTIKLIEDPAATSLLTPDNKPIEPLGLEPLIVEVSTTAAASILAVDPPNGAIDARRHRQGEGGWKSIQLQVSKQGSDLKAEDFEVDDGTINPPPIERLTVDGSVALLTLSRPIRSGAWTKITHKSGASFRIGTLPGDVNNDGKTDSADVSALIDALNNKSTLPLFRCDVNADGKLTSQDLAALVDLLTDSQGSPARLME